MQTDTDLGIQTCGQCGYWFPKEPEAEGSRKDRGECKRFPNIVEKDRLSWCGEFRFQPWEKRKALITEAEKRMKSV